MHLADFFIPILAHVTELLATVGEKQPSYDEVRGAVEQLFLESEPALTSFPRDDVELARFAVAAWVDEALIGSPWEHKQIWLREQLQRRYFGTTAAGEEFFQRLEALGPRQQEVREVYYLCLALGFTGRFCKPGDERDLLEIRKLNLNRLLEDGVSQPDAVLFPEAQPTDSGSFSAQKKSSVPFTTALCLGAPVLLFAVLFVIYRIILSSVTDNLLITLSN